MERFAEIFNAFWLLNISSKRSMLDVWQGFEYGSVRGPSYFVNQIWFANEVSMVKSVSDIRSKLTYKIKGQ